MTRSALIFLCMSLLLAPGLSVCAAADTEPNCNIQEESCTQTVGGRTVELDITPKPVKAMEELTFRVSVTGDDLKKPPHIDLGMPAMEMGPNQVTMKKVSDSVYKGTGVIVRCPSGKTIWEAEVTIPGAGQASFIFDVVY